MLHRLTRSFPYFRVEGLRAVAIAATDHVASFARFFGCLSETAPEKGAPAQLCKERIKENEGEKNREAA